MINVPNMPPSTPQGPLSTIAKPAPETLLMAAATMDGMGKFDKLKPKALSPLGKKK